MNYKPIETEFVKNGYRFRQIRREGDVAIFHKVALKGAKHPSSFDGGFEVVSISRHDGYELGGNVIEPAESYPSSEMWGTKGFTFTTLFAAEVKYDTLLGKSVDTADISTNDVIGGDNVEMPVSEVITENKPSSGHRGRVAKVRAEVVYPSTEQWTLNDILAINADYDRPTMYVYIQKQINDNVVKAVGQAPKSVGQRGKSANLYSKI